MFTQEFWQTFRLGSRRRYLHTYSPVLRKCCGCIHLRAGAMIMCFVWMGLSMYFAAISFQHKSPFFSFMSDAAMLIFGTINLFFACLAGYAAFTIFHNQIYFIQQVTIWVTLGVLTVVIDTIVNVVIFIVIRSSYLDWCIGSAYESLEQGVSQALGNNTTNINFFTDFYNCDRTWEDELKFAILCAVMMTLFYGYWALCFYSYYRKKFGNPMQPSMLQNQMTDPVLHQLNNPVASTSAGYMAPPPPFDHARSGNAPDDAPVIVLSNAKPSKKEKHRSSSSSLPPPYEHASRMEMAQKPDSPIIVIE
ncbi:hypothetical protein DM01DRAFT_1386759 [Hesseltinella vesiculosa]|uniref:Uncharacterized protein n=1 Tax=Hesseltinella vesiculosa TaxID=101127 RepID=A0A1X2G4S8_9FUNG|nr:hypothetical protein DM01DRAFT_1386759 [Hesseltinella vesiculosa]